MHLLFDIGGSKMRLAVSKNGKHIDQSIILHSPQDFNEALTAIGDEVAKLTGGEKLTSAVGGIAAIFDEKRSTIVRASHLPMWSHQPIQKILSEKLNCPVFLENDAAMVGLGEAVSGPGMGKDIVAYLTISTGVGGARIVNGKIDKSTHGFEPGHQIVNSEGEPCPSCHLPGHLESYISGSALEKKHHQLPEEITDPQVWNEVEKYLAIGVHNTICYWSPDIIILGGSVTKHINLESVVKHLKELFNIHDKLPEIEKSKADDLGGLYGAIVYLNQLST